MASTRYHRITLTLNSPWNLGTATTHNWHVTFSLSGTASLSHADLDATSLDLWDPIRQLTRSVTSLIGWRYYPSGTNVSSDSASYTPGTHIGDTTGYSGSMNGQQLEVCMLARCPVGKNSKGRQVYLRKWIHGIGSDTSNYNAIPPLHAQSTILSKWMTGSGPSSLVPVDPTDGTQGGPWSIETHLFTHQLRRGPKHKVIPPPNPI